MRLRHSVDVDLAYREHGPSVYRRAMRLLGNRADAEEALQEVFMRVLSTESGYQEKSELICWLYRITTNYCLNRIRDRKRRTELFQEHVVPNTERFTANTPVDLITMRWLLAHADERQAQAATYIFLDGLSYEEAAPLLGVSRSTVGNLIERFQTFCVERLKIKGAPAAPERGAQPQTKEVR